MTPSLQAERRRFRDAAAAVSYAALFGALLLPTILSGRLLGMHDAPIEALPAFYAERTLWTPDLWAGFPSAADPISQSWYPLSFLLARIPQGWNLFVALGYILMATFTCGYVSTITGCRIAGFASGLVFALAAWSHSLFHLGHIVVLHTLVWMPLVFWALERLRYRPSALWMAVGSLAVANAYLAGHPQTFLYVMTVVLAYIAVTAAADSSDRWPFLGRSGGLLAIGAGLGAVQLLPTIELVRQSVRSAITFAEASQFALPPSLALVALFFHPGPWSQPALSAYVGWGVLLLGVVGLLARGPRWRAAFWGSVAVIAFLLSLGDATPLAVLIYHVPVFNLFRAPIRHLSEMTFALSVTAGIGFAAVIRGAISSRRLICAAGAGLMLLAVGSVALTALRRAGSHWILTRGVPSHEFVADGFTPCVALVAIASVLVVSARWPQTGWPPVAVVLLLALDLSLTGWLVEANYPWPTRSILDPPPNAARYRQLLSVDHQRILPIRGAASDSPNELPPNLSRIWKVPSASGYGPLISARLSQLLLMTPAGEVHGPWSAAIDQSLDVLAVRFVLLPAAAWSSMDPATVPGQGARWQLVERVGTTAVVENLRAMPRSWLVPAAQTARPGEILRALRTSVLPDGKLFDARHIALVEESVDLTGSPGTLRDAEVRLLKLSDTSLQVSTRSPSRAFLVVSDVHYPGWAATLDGAPAHLLRTDYLLRGMMVPAGTHTVQLRFRPGSVYAGGAISLLAALVLAGVACRRRRPVADGTFSRP